MAEAVFVWGFSPLLLWGICCHHDPGLPSDLQLSELNFFLLRASLQQLWLLCVRYYHPTLVWASECLRRFGVDHLPISDLCFIFYYLRDVLKHCWDGGVQQECDTCRKKEKGKALFYQEETLSGRIPQGRGGVDQTG